VAAHAAGADVATLEELLLQMWRIRAFETRAMELFEEKLIRGSVHPYVGMEAIAVGVCAALGPDDYITSTHRGHGHCIAKGLELRLMMAEILGREAGYCRGKGGSMHITAMEHNMLGADAIVAGSTAIAVGAAHGLRLRGEDGVVVCFFGDGAANQGILHEACNLGAVLAAPVVFVCENNEWAISTPLSHQMAQPDVYKRAAGYGMPGVVVDGFDPIACYSAVHEAMERARHGGGPTLVEAKCYRFLSHTTDDDDRTYRSREEVEERRKDDPVPKFERLLVENAVLTPEGAEGLRKAVLAEANEATDRAETMAYPKPEDLFKNVYADSWEPWR